MGVRVHLPQQIQLPTVRVRFPRSSLRRRRNPPTQRLGDLPLEARVTERPSAIRRSAHSVEKLFTEHRSKKPAIFLSACLRIGAEATIEVVVTHESVRVPFAWA